MIIVLAGALAIVLGTVFGAPTLTPIMVGIVIGLAWPRRAARVAAAAGATAWGALLAVALLRGGAIGTLANTLGGAMGVPGVVLFLATLLYPAILAASAAWLAHLVSWRRSDSTGSAAIMARGPSHS
jgi:hypothetical protein